MYSIIIVEDEPLELEFVKSIIMGSVASEDIIHISRSGRDAVVLAKRHCPDMIFIDLGLPEQDGMSAIAQIREFLPDCCICIITGQADFCCAQKAITYQVFEYMLKPVRPEELKKTFKKMQKETDRLKGKRISHDTQDRMPAAQSKELGQIERSLRYIREHFQEKLLLEDVAAQAYMSPQYFSRVFKRETGMTYSHYVAKMKIEHACMLLDATDYPAYRISLECGFSNPAYFSKVFVSHMKMTPQAYRKRER